MFRYFTLTAAMLLLGACGTALSPMSTVAPDSSTSDHESIILKANRVFAPVGFDDNDEIQLVLDGWVNNACESAVAPKANIDLNSLSIELIPMGIRQEGMCAQVRSRFSSVASLGILPHGTYRVYTNDGLIDKSLEIKEANSAGPDDYVYAQVDRAWVDFAPEIDADSRWSAVLEGRLMNSCQSIAEIRVIDSTDTVEILPIIKEEGEACHPIEQTFVERAFLPDYTKPGRYLLHVRSAGGTAINDVFSTFGGVQ